MYIHEHVSFQEEMGNIDQKMETSDQNQYPNLLSSTSLDKSDKGGRRSSEDLFAVHDFNIEIDLDVPASSEYRGSLPPHSYTTVLNYFDCLELHIHVYIETKQCINN